MIEAKLTIYNKVGLHARPAALFVQTANRCASKITVRNLTAAKGPVNAKSIVNILSLGVVQNHEILIAADGSDEQDAIDQLKMLIDNNFGES